MDWTNIISTVGFPIASFLLASLGIKYVYDNESAKSRELTDKITTLAESVSENTKTLAVLVNEIHEHMEEV